MQWASSTATTGMVSAAASARKPGLASRSGAMYSSLYAPPRAFAMTSAISAVSSELFRQAAGTPACSSAATWSFISEISGEMTSVTPGRSSAGSW